MGLDESKTRSSASENQSQSTLKNEASLLVLPSKDITLQGKEPESSNSLNRESQIEAFKN